MSGRIEAENKLREKIEEKLETLPPIFRGFYNYMEADQKSYATIKHYVEYVADFMDEVAQGDKEEFYKYVTVPQIREYIVSLRRRTENGKEVIGVYKFILVWQYKDNVWKVTRVVSIGH
jgi:hypothetical protein